MAKFRKNLIVSDNNYSGTGILAKLSFSSKFYLALFLLALGLSIQSVVALSCFYEYRSELINLANFRQDNDHSIAVFHDLLRDLEAKFEISGRTGIPMEVTDGLNQVNLACVNLKRNFDDQIALEQIAHIEELIAEFNKIPPPLSVEAYQETVPLFQRFQVAVNSLEAVFGELYQRNYREILVIMVIKFTSVFLILLLEIKFCKWLASCALRSVEEPAERIIRGLQGPNGDLQVKLPILASEGLGATGLILNEAISKWHSLALEFKNAGNKLHYLVDELASGFNQLFFIEVQLGEVYSEIESSLKDQQHIGNRVDEEIETVGSKLSELLHLPGKMNEIAQKFNSLLTVNQDYLSSIADKQLEINDESHDLKAFLWDLGATSSQIDRIMKKLEEIEEESEMLAFNSAISAARAGEEGRGFSVVAKEIANLVERSKRASTSLGEIIGEIQTQTDYIVGLIPENAADEFSRVSLDRFLTVGCQNLNETTAKCVIELTRMCQEIERIFIKSSETFEEINSKLNSSPVKISGLSEIGKTIARYLESVKYTRELKDKIYDTVNNLLLATDRLINRNV
mgnify:CR=1 FL=1